MIFTTAINNGEIAACAIRSFYLYHDHPITVFGTPSDFDYIDQNGKITFVDCSELKDSFNRGHEGTAKVFARACQDGWIIHFDSDVIFLKSCIDKLLKATPNIVSTRRCYEKNHGGIKGLKGIPDSMSTYLFAMDTKFIQHYTIEYLSRMWQGAVHPLKYKILDFGDPVFHTAMDNGATYRYLDQDKYGGQDENGSKKSKYELNMHMDAGEYLIHFGGVGSGQTYAQGDTQIEKGYGTWAMGRYALYASTFLGRDIEFSADTEYKDGRWVNGCADDHIKKLLNGLLRK